MRKVLFLLLFLVILGAANVSAQVRIGGDEEPNAAAVLDLNVDDSNDGTKGLALPRVNLASNKDKLVYSDLLEGMLVYNTNAGMTGGNGVGVYYWDGSEWVKNMVTINNGAVSMAKTTLSMIVIRADSLGLAAGSYLNVRYPAGCSYNNSWVTTNCQGWCVQAVGGGGVQLRRVNGATSAEYDAVRFWCFI